MGGDCDWAGNRRRIRAMAEAAPQSDEAMERAVKEYSTNKNVKTHEVDDK